MPKRSERDGIHGRNTWKEFMEEPYKTDLNKPDYYDGVVSHPEPDILECEVKWVLGKTLLFIKLVDAIEFW